MLYPDLYENILHYTKVPEKDYAELELLFTPRQFKQGSYIFKAGEICKEGIFVRSGCLSYFTLDEEGNEFIVDLATKGWWTGDGESFFKKSKSIYSIKAVYEAEVLLIEMEKALYAIERYPFYLYYHYFALLDYRNRTDKLLKGALHASAEQKYLELISQRPDIVQMVPLYDIASFLGITPQSLSRLRKKIAERKD